MTAMLDSMLDVNRIESGIVRPEMRPVAIAPLIQRLVDEFGPQCSLKGLKLRSVPCRPGCRPIRSCWSRCCATCCPMR
jgi:two-component system, chemotaxis family, CheB/CheR fusion protein